MDLPTRYEAESGEYKLQWRKSKRIYLFEAQD